MYVNTGDIISDLHTFLYTSTMESSMKIEEIVPKIIFLILGILLTFYINTGVSSLDKLSTSVNELNVKIGVMVERTDTLQKEVKDHSDRIRMIEIKKEY